MRTFGYTIGRIESNKLATSHIDFRCRSIPIVNIQQKAGTLSIKHCSFELASGDIDYCIIHHIDKIRSSRVYLLIVEVTAIDVDYSIIISPNSHAVTINI